jgi:tyrosine-protein kinase Etk/Wzc
MTAASPDDIDISAIWRSLRKSVPKLVLASLVIGALAFAALSYMQPRYTSEAQIQVVPPEQEGRTGGGSSYEAVAARLDKEAINTHLRAIMSPDLAVEIISEEGLAEKPEFNSALRKPTLLDRIKSALDFTGQGKVSEQDRVLRAYFDRLEVDSPKETRAINIRFSSEDPSLAAEIANKIASTYRTSLATRTVAGTDEVQKALQPKIDKLKQEVSAAEAEVEKFRGQANIFKGGPNDTGLNQQQLGDLTAELSKVQAARGEAEARANSVRDIVAAGNAESLPEVQKSPLIQNLVQQRVRLQRQLSELSATLLPAHPRMRRIRADLQGLERQIKSEVGKVVDGIEKAAKVTALREEAIEKNIANTKARVVGTGGDQVKLRQLEANAKSKRLELERLQARYEANRARADSRAIPIEAQIIGQARPASVPSFPKKVPYSVLVGVAIFLFGIAIIVTRALFSAARTPGDDKGAWSPAASSLIRSGAHAPASATQPSAAQSVGAITKIDSVSALAEQLLVRPPDIGGFRTLITGEAEGFDAGNDGIELATTLSEAGADVMLVDWSLDGRGVATAAGVPSRPGITDLLQGKAKFEDVVARVPGSNVQMIAAGSVVSDAETLLDPDQLNLALDALDTAYDHIVVVARNAPARALFEAIQGRFDAGVVVAEAKRRPARMPDVPGTFLGFEVADIELFRLEHPVSSQVAAERLARFISKGSDEAHTL